MKKFTLKIWLLGIIGVLLLGACRQGESQPIQMSEASQESTEVEAVSGASVTRRFYQEQIPYPHFTNIANAEAINNAILSYLGELSQRLIFDEGTSLDYALLFENADFISIIFEGSTIHGTYPRAVKESLNLNLREIVFTQPLGELLIEISQDDSSKGQFVFTSEDLTLYLSVQHALGDYLEIRLPLEALALSL